MLKLLYQIKPRIRTNHPFVAPDLNIKSPVISKDIQQLASFTAEQGPYLFCHRITPELERVKKTTNSEQFSVFDEISRRAFEFCGYWGVSREHLNTVFNEAIVSELIRLRVLHQSERGWYTHESVHRAKIVYRAKYRKAVTSILEKRKSDRKFRNAEASRRVRQKQKRDILSIEMKTGIRLYANTPLFVLDFIKKNATLKGIIESGARILPSHDEIVRQRLHTRQMNSPSYFEWHKAFEALSNEKDILIKRDYRYSVHVKKLVESKVTPEHLTRAIELARHRRIKSGSDSPIYVGLLASILLTENFSKSTTPKNLTIVPTHSLQGIHDHPPEPMHLRKERARKYLSMIPFKIGRPPT